MKLYGYELIATPPFDEPRWERRWETGVAASARRNEERESKIGAGFKSLSFTVLPVTLEERAGLEMAVREGLKTGKACAPFWGRSSVLALDVTADVVTVEATAWDWAIADGIFLFDQENRLWEARTITNVAAGGGGTIVLTLNGGAVARTYKAGTLVWPIIYGKLSCDDLAAIENHRGTLKLKISERDVSFSKGESNCPVISTYLGRPIAPVAVGGLGGVMWTRSVGKSFAFDLRELLIGFGLGSFGPLENHVAHGWEFSVLLEGDTEIKKWDCFTASLRGRANGFWMPDAQCVFEIVSAPAADTLQVKDSGLAETWAASPDAYVIFRKDGSADQIAKITAVADIGAGLEEVTLDAALALDDSWEAYRLRYVRLADDVEAATFTVENRQTRDVRVIELPEEYAAVETGTQPVWLYTFWIEPPGGPVYWRYTSYPAQIVSNGSAFGPANINHGAIKRSMGAERDEVTIDGERVAGNIFTYLAPLTPALKVWVKIEEATVSAPNATTALFVGLVTRAPMDGRKVSARCSGMLDALGGNAPGFLIGPSCNYKVFKAGCFKAGRPTPGPVLADYQATVNITVISADRRTITMEGAALSGNNPVGFSKATLNYWAAGYLETGAGTNYQLITILSSTAALFLPTATVTFKLARPLGASAAVGHAVTLTPGCERSLKTCLNKFDNRVNYGGHDRVPDSNPSIARPNTATNAGKK